MNKQDRPSHRASPPSPTRRCCSGDCSRTFQRPCSRSSPPSTARRRNRTPEIRDLRDLLWCSIDNDDSRDLDQLTVAEPLHGGDANDPRRRSPTSTRSSRRARAIDAHAATNTTSVYTAARHLSDAAGEALDRPHVARRRRGPARGRRRDDGRRRDGEVAGERRLPRRRAQPRQARLQRRGGVARGRRHPPPQRSPRSPGSTSSCALQDDVAQRAQALRRRDEARSTLETIEARPVFDGGALADLRPDAKNRAKELIEDFMIAANGATARFLEHERVSVAAPRACARRSAGSASSSSPRSSGDALPATPDAAALDAFLDAAPAAGSRALSRPLARRRQAAGLGRVRRRAARASRAEGHFGLAVKDYTHSTAPNRRFPGPHHAAAAEGGARRAARRRTRSTSCARSPRTARSRRTTRRRSSGRCASPRRRCCSQRRIGAAVRRHRHRRVRRRARGCASSHPPVEGRVVRGFEGLDVGDRVRVELVHTDVDARLHRLRARAERSDDGQIATTRDGRVQGRAFLDSDDARPLRILAEYLRADAGVSTASTCRDTDRLLRLRAARAGRPARPLLRRRARARAPGHRVVARACPRHCARYVVCSGGGGGIMEAANRGAADAGGRTIGLNIGLPHEQRPNPYITPELTFEFHYFFMRKLWFAHLARALVVFPGGFGTLDEMIEILTLAQTQKLARRIPVVLYGRSYWNEIIDFDALVRHGMIARRGPDAVQLRRRSADRIEAAPARTRPDARARTEEDAGFRAFANTAGRRGLSRGFPSPCCGRPARRDDAREIPGLKGRAAWGSESRRCGAPGQDVRFLRGVLGDETFDSPVGHQPHQCDDDEEHDAGPRGERPCRHDAAHVQHRRELALEVGRDRLGQQRIAAMMSNEAGLQHRVRHRAQQQVDAIQHRRPAFEVVLAHPSRRERQAATARTAGAGSPTVPPR